MSALITIALTVAQAQHLHARDQLLKAAELKRQEAEADLAELISFACAGHAPAGSTVVSLNTETGLLVMQPPDAP